MNYKMARLWFLEHFALGGEIHEEALKKGLEAIEKQIPKKVQIKEYNPAVCPSCGHELSESVGDGYYRHLTFLEICPKCYQRLDWGDSD